MRLDCEGETRKHVAAMRVSRRVTGPTNEGECESDELQGASGPGVAFLSEVSWDWKCRSLP